MNQTCDLDKSGINVFGCITFLLYDRDVIRWQICCHLYILHANLCNLHRGNLACLAKLVKPSESSFCADHATSVLCLDLQACLIFLFFGSIFCSVVDRYSHILPHRSTLWRLHWL